MLQFSLGVTRIHKNRNEHIRGTAQLGRFGENMRGKAEVVWIVRRNDDGYICRTLKK